MQLPAVETDLRWNLSLRRDSSMGMDLPQLACLFPSALALSNYNGNISKCSIKWTAWGGGGGQGEMQDKLGNSLSQA